MFRPVEARGKEGSRLVVVFWFESGACKCCFLFWFWLEGDGGSGGDSPRNTLTLSLLGSGALADALLGRGDLGPKHRHAPEVARERRHPLSRALAVDGKVREPVDSQGLDGGAHLGRGLAVDGHKVDVRVVGRQLPEFRGQRAARRACRDVKLEDREARRRGKVIVARRRGKRPRDGGLEVGDRPRGRDVGGRGELVPVVVGAEEREREEEEA